MPAIALVAASPNARVSDVRDMGLDGAHPVHEVEGVHEGPLREGVDERAVALLRDLAHLAHLELLTPKPEESLRFFVDVNGSNEMEVASEVDRYCSWPGQACGYKVGHSEINRLRDRAKTSLGPRYDFKSFNDAVVLGGNVPMTVLGHVVDRHIAARKA